MADFRQDLITALNKHSVDGLLDMPDFILADLLIHHIDALKSAQDRVRIFHEQEAK